jgi:hypothetical protein
MNEYHGIVINVSQKNKSILKKLDVIGKKAFNFNTVILLKIRVPKENLEETIQQLQTNMRDRFLWWFHDFYFHFYNDQELIVVFKNRIFRVTPDPKTWDEMVAYGLSLGLPEKQLDFFPCRFSDETY